MALKEPKTPAKRVAEPEYVDKPSPFSIEGIRSGAVQSRLMKTVVVLSGLIMAGTFLVSSLSPSGVPRNGNGGSGQSPDAVAATLGNQTISEGQLNNAFARSVQINAQYGMGIPTAATFLDQKQTALRQLTNQAALTEAAKAANIVVSDAEIDAELDKEIKEQFKPQAGQSQAAFLRLVQAQYKVSSIDEAVAQEKAKVTSDIRDNVRDKLSVDKLEKQVKDAASATVSEDDYKRSLTKLDLYSITLRPDLPKGGAKDFKAEQTRLQNEAAAKATKLFAQLKATPTLAAFKAVAAKENPDVISKAKSGALGQKLPAELSPPEVGTALSKAAGSLVGPFKSEGDGSQTIYFIAGRKTDLPKDYAKNKKKLLADFQTQQAGAAWSKKQADIQKAATPDVSDPALKAYQLQTKDLYTKVGDEQRKARADVLARYNDALKTSGTGLEAAAIHYQRAALYSDMGQKEPRLQALKAASDAAKKDVELLLTYAEALRDAGQPKPALEQFKAASKALDNNPMPTSMFSQGDPNAPLRQRLAQAFELLKEPKLAAAERAKVKPAAPGGMGGMSGLNFGGSPGLQVVPQRK